MILSINSTGKLATGYKLLILLDYRNVHMYRSVILNFDTDVMCIE